MSESAGEKQMAEHIVFAELPPPEREFEFHAKRRWRFDFAWPDHMIALEVHGGTFSYGAHTRAEGFERDREKMAHAFASGWSVLEVTTRMVQNGSAIEHLIAGFVNHPPPLE